ncbi:MAG: hypothetical protein IV093_10255 [Rubrivivax sp.]|nr:hypothetical protein [Rubrivivax sp.]
MNAKTRIASLLAALLLAACGGGGDDPAEADPPTGGGGGGGTPAPVALTCNTANYTAGSVAAPTATELAAYAGTFNGEEGSYDANFAFVKSGDAVLVLGTTPSVTYKGTLLTATSFCLDNTAGPYGRILYVEVNDNGHFDISATDAGDGLRFAWGVAPGGAIFRNGVKQ